MVIHPKINILPKPFPLGCCKLNNVKMKKEKTIIPRAEDVRARTYTKFDLLINRYLYKRAMRSIRKEIKSAVRQRKGWIRLDGSDWRLVRFPELIDYLKYLGYRIKKTWIDGYYISWDDKGFKECPGEEI